MRAALKENWLSKRLENQLLSMPKHMTFADSPFSALPISHRKISEHSIGLRLSVKTTPCNGFHFSSQRSEEVRANRAAGCAGANRAAARQVPFFFAGEINVRKNTTEKCVQQAIRNTWTIREKLAIENDLKNASLHVKL